MTNQHTIVLFAVPLVICVILNQRINGSVSFTHIVVYGLYCIAGLIPLTQTYFSCIWVDSPVSWGKTDTLVGLLWHLVRGDYGSFRLYPGDDTSGTHMIERMTVYFEELFEKAIPSSFCGWAALGAALFCLFEEPVEDESIKYGPKVKGGVRKKVAAKKQKVSMFVSMSLLCTFFFYIFVFNYLSNMPLIKAQPHLGEIRKRFWQQPHLIFCIFSSAGIYLFLEVTWAQFCRPVLTLPAKIFGFVLACTVIGSVLNHTRNWYSQNLRLLHLRSSSDIVSRYGMSILNSVEPDTVLLTQGDIEWSTLQYFQRCRRLRTDVVVLSTEFMQKDWYHDVINRRYFGEAIRFGNFSGSSDVFRRVIQAIRDQTSRPISYTGSNDQWKERMGSDENLYPTGFVLTTNKRTKIDQDVLWQLPGHQEKILNDTGMFASPKELTGTWEWLVSLRAWQRAKMFWETWGSLAQSKVLTFESSEAFVRHMSTCAHQSKLLLAVMPNWYDVIDEDEKALILFNTGIMLFRVADTSQNKTALIQSMHHFRLALEFSGPRVINHPSFHAVMKITRDYDEKAAGCHYKPTQTIS
mmetsp:Transcript_14818/g.31609  ORF Transcript_14818/g.31609 Transcript_14818/m.31609 type:complete len:578 (-) Transcript_14818:2225-3958(-)